MVRKYSKKIGFLLTHGTDSMSWALSAIRYTLKNLPANVAITGSQVPFSMQFSSSDVYPNVENSIKLLTQLTGPNIFVVFNNGQAAFQDDLWKIDKWSPDAFRGEELARISSDEIFIRGRAYPLNLNRKLDKLFLIRTGGTIESEHNEDGVLTPTANLISDYITQKFAGFFHEFESISLMSKDSSDLILDSWFQICKRIAKECQNAGFTTFCDTKFNQKIIVVNTTPMMTEEEYRKRFASADGIILNAYGSGTINTDINSGHSPLPAIEQAIANGKIVILSSQTPIGTQDFVYQNAWLPIMKGAIPSGDFSIAHSQIKLSYLLGHKKELEKFAKKIKIPADIFIKIAFLAGVDFRSYTSRKKYEKLIGYPIPLKDPFFNLPFEISLQKIQRFLNKKETQQITISSIAEFEKAYKSHFSNPNQRSKWAVILKPDTVIGSNQWGELIDASKNFATITKEILDWNVVILELSEMSYAKFLDKVKEHCVGESLGEFLRSFRYVIVEGGRQSLYDSKSFTEITNGNFERKDYLHLLRSIMLARNNPGSSPALFICLGHQGVAETFRDYIVELCKKAEKIAKIISKKSKIVSEEFLKTIGEIKSQGNNLAIKNRNEEIIANSINDQYFAVKKNELPEFGLKKLVKFRPEASKNSKEMLDEYQDTAIFQTGILEDLYSLETLDIIMLHGDEVNEEAVLFFNWAFKKIADFSQKNFELLLEDEGLSELTTLPFGLEIPSSTLYSIESKDGDYLTEIAGMVIYYYNPKTNIIKRDYTLQFHPELFEEIQILQKRDFESKTLLELSDGIQLLLSSLQAGFIETHYKY